MKTTIIRTTGYAVLALFLLFTSCSKEDNTSKPVTKAALVARNWKQTDLLASQTGTPEVSVFTTFMEACDRDNIWQFKADGTFTVMEGASKCISSDPDTVTSGTWQLAENDTKIIIDDVKEPAETLTIRELTSTSFKITGTQVSNGTSFTATIVFAPQ